MLAGNKMDLVDDDNPQVVGFKDGQRLAEVREESFGRGHAFNVSQ